MGNELETMARDFYGYGSWDAPYWFIGPEQGGGNNPQRAKAFLDLQIDGLCDCKQFHFHKEIGEKRWHREPPEVVALEKTWRRLMLLLMPSLKRGSDQGTLRTYQRDLWGMRHAGETCVIELSGLSAKNQKVALDRESFRDERTAFIRKKMESHKPKLVVVYGKAGSKNWEAAKKQWERVTGCGLVLGDVVVHDSAAYAFSKHPNTRRVEDKAWRDLGDKIAEVIGTSKVQALART